MGREADRAAHGQTQDTAKEKTALLGQLSLSLSLSGHPPLHCPWGKLRRDTWLALVFGCMSPKENANSEVNICHIGLLITLYD